MYFKTTRYFAIGAALLLSACGNEANTNNSNEADLQVVADSLNLEQSQAEVAPVELDALYPDVKQLKNIPMLFTGNLILGEKPDPNKGWMGIFIDRQKSYIDGTTVYVKQDKEDDFIYSISTVHSDSAIILLSGLDFEFGELNWVRLPEMPYSTVNINKSFDFELAHKYYSLRAEGDSQPDDLPMNYKLYLKGEKGGKMIDDLIVCIPQFNGSGSVSEILFVGDLDRDNIPDVIVNTSSAYNVYCPTLYLSSQADENHLVKPIGYELFTD